MGEKINIDWAASWESANALANRYRDALQEIKEFTRGYGDIALVVHRMADKALRADSGEVKS